MRLFDFKHDSETGRKKATDAVINGTKIKGGNSSMESLMPFYSIDGSFLRCIDGSTIVYLTYPGENLSLANAHEQSQYAAKNASVLSGLTADVVGVWLVPQETPMRGNLTIVDERISEYTKKIVKPSSKRELEHYRALLKICEDYLRPDMHREVLTNDSDNIISYIGLKYRYATDKEINTAVNSFISSMSKATGKKPEVLGEYEIYDFIDLFVKGSIPPHRTLGQQVIMPEV